MSYPSFREPPAGIPSRPGVRARLARHKRGVIAGAAVIVVAVAAATVYLTKAAADPESPNALVGGLANALARRVTARGLGLRRRVHSRLRAAVGRWCAEGPRDRLGIR